MKTKSEWCGVYIGSVNSMMAVKSWFSPYCDSADILSARVLSDVATDATKKVEIIAVINGDKKRVIRTFGKRGYKIVFKRAL